MPPPPHFEELKTSKTKRFLYFQKLFSYRDMVKRETAFLIPFFRREVDPINVSRIHYFEKDEIKTNSHNKNRLKNLDSDTLSSK